MSGEAQGTLLNGEGLGQLSYFVLESGLLSAFA